MSKVVLITGAYGFVGRYTAKYYKSMDYTVIGAGHGNWDSTEYTLWGIDLWYECDITLDNLLAYAKNVDIIVHCAGSGSVRFSIENPMLDFERTVWTTHFILEYIRKYAKNIKLIYPSSAAVYGLTKQLPIKEETSLNPISPYGLHKKMAEELCKMYAKQYGLSIIIMRLFSVYGDGLKKQLLWDACKKIEKDNNVFWGTGEETRDWIHVKDVAMLMYIAREKANNRCAIVNVASGQNVKIADVLTSLFSSFSTSLKPVFGLEENLGNPEHYLADIQKIRQWGWENTISLKDGIIEYVKWYKKYGKN